MTRPPYRGTRIRPVRVSDELWQAAQDTAEHRRETVAEVVRRALAAYVRRHRRDITPGAPQGGDD